MTTRRMKINEKVHEWFDNSEASPCEARNCKEEDNGLYFFATRTTSAKFRMMIGLCENHAREFRKELMKKKSGGQE